MNKQVCVAFLQWALPRLRLRWQGFRRVRRQVCRRLQKRVQKLDLPDLVQYQDFLENQPPEWQWLDEACRITISRFYRNRRLWQNLATVVLPRLADGAGSRREPTLSCWSIGCASGEEPYTLALVWHFEVQPVRPKPELAILATDTDPVLLQRAKAACYPPSSLRELPPKWLGQAFSAQNGSYCLRKAFREQVRFLQQDIRQESAPGPFHLLACRNLVFTYFTPDLQQEVLAGLAEVLLPGGALVLGSHEVLPTGAAGFQPWSGVPGVYQKTG